MGRKVGNANSVRVAVGANATINQGDFVYLDGFLGLAVQGITTDADGKVTSYNVATFGTGEFATLPSAEIALNIEKAEYETDQVADAATFEKGDAVYWDDTAKLLTDDDAASANTQVGKVTEAGEGYIWFILTNPILA